MRLIDADALLKAIHKARYVKGKPISFMTIIKIKELIFNTPTIDAVPVQHEAGIGTSFVSINDLNKWQDRIILDEGKSRNCLVYYVDGDQHDSC